MTKKGAKKILGAEQREQLLDTLQKRFEANMKRHQGVSWAKVQTRLDKAPDKLWALSEMERTGGEPDVVGQDSKTSEYLFYDCAAETPTGRRSLCYDRAALDARKQHKPKGNAVELATAMGVTLLDEARYRQLQALGPFDTKTSSWLETPSAIRKLGGAIFGDHRYGTVFIYHNGAESYYAARGFRCWLGV